MSYRARPARINVKAVVILGLVVVLLGGGLVAGHYIRKKYIAEKALAAGQAAIETKDWAAATRNLKEYLDRYPNNPQVLRQYGDAQLEIRPLEARNIGAAISAYRRLLRFEPGDRELYRTLATLYTGTGNFNDLQYIADKLCEQTGNPQDPDAVLWRASALIAQRKMEEAREVLLPVVEAHEQLPPDTRSRSQPAPGQPDYRTDYVAACLQLSRIALNEGGSNAADTALGWLNRAIEHEPRAVEALVRRAQLYRVIGDQFAQPLPEPALRLARADLEAADALQPADPRVRLVLSQEWGEHGELERAAAELQAADEAARSSLRKYFFRPSDWLVLRFVQSADIALRRGAPQDCVPLADETLAALTDRRERVAVIPAAVEVYAEAGEIEKAEKALAEFEDVAGLIEGTADFNEARSLLRGLMAKAHDDPYGVIEALQGFADRDVTRPKILRLLADAFEDVDQRGRACGALQRYVTLQPEDLRARLRLIRYYLDLHDWAKAVSEASATVSRWPENVQANALFAEARIQAAAFAPPTAARESLRQAEADVARLREADPQDVSARILEATLAARKGEAERAEQILLAAIDECRTPLAAELALSRLYYSQGRPVDAREMLQSSCERDGTTATPWIALAGAYQVDKRIDEARETLDAGLKAVATDADRYDLKLQRSLLELKQGDAAEGLRQLEQMAADNPRDLRVRSILLDRPEVRADRARMEKLLDELKAAEGDAGLLWRAHQAALLMSDPEGWRGHAAEIEKLLLHCVHADPRWEAPVLMLGELYERQNETDRAESTYRSGLSANPGALSIAARLLALLESGNRYAEAKDVLDQLGTDAPLPPERRASVLFGAGEGDDAIDYLKNLLAASPEDENVRVLLARMLFEKTADPDAALAYLDDAGEPSLNIALTRASILKAAGKVAEARQVLDAQVDRNPGASSYTARAFFLASIGESDAAEEDFKQLTRLDDPARGHLLLGMFYEDQERVQEAIDTWEQGLETAPGDVPLLRKLIPALLTRSDPKMRERGVTLLAGMAAEHPDDAQVLWLRAGELLKSGTPQEIAQAEQLLAQLMQMAPNSSSAYIKMYDLAMRRGDVQEAREWTVRGLSKIPDDTSLLLARAQAEAALGQTQLALNITQDVIRKNPDLAYAYTMLADVALNADSKPLLEEVLPVLADAAQRMPNEEALQRIYARTLMRLGRGAEALSRVQELATTPAAQESPEPLLLLAEFQYGQGNEQAAQQALDEAAARFPDHWKVQRARVQWWGAHGQMDKIVTFLQENPPRSLAQANVAFTAVKGLLAAGTSPHVEQAIRSLEQIAAAAPDLHEARLLLASLKFQNGDAGGAIAIYRELLKQDPSNINALNDLAWVLATKPDADPGSLEEALELASQGLGLDPDNLHLLDTRGEVLTRLPDRHHDAREDFARYAALTESQPALLAPALLKLARICIMLEDHTAARQYLDRARSLEEQSHVLNNAQRDELARLIESTEAQSRQKTD